MARYISSTADGDAQQKYEAADLKALKEIVRRQGLDFVLFNINPPPPRMSAYALSFFARNDSEAIYTLINFATRMESRQLDPLEVVSPLFGANGKTVGIAVTE